MVLYLGSTLQIIPVFPWDVPDVQLPEIPPFQPPKGPLRGSYVAGHADHAVTDNRTSTHLLLYISKHLYGLNSPSPTPDGHRPSAHPPLTDIPIPVRHTHKSIQGPSIGAAVAAL